MALPVLILMVSATPLAAQEVARPVMLGSESAADSAWFGLIEDVAIHPSGKVIVLDRLADFHLLVFAPDGRLLQRLGRTERGPGEFRGPRGVTVARDGRLYVLDDALRRVSIFEVEPRIAHLADARVNAAATDLCAMHGRIYLLGSTELGPGRSVLEEYDVADSTLRFRRSLGRLDSRHPLASSPLMEQPLTTGVMACAPRSNTVIWIPRYLAEVHTVATDGGASHLAPIPEYSATQFSIEDSHTIAMAMPKVGLIHQTLAVYPAGDTTLLVQLGTVTREDAKHRGAFTYYETRTMTPGGQELGKARGESRLADSRGDRFVCVRNDPTPAAWVYRRQPGKLPTCP